MAEIRLTNGLIAVVDESDLTGLSKFNWRCASSYAVRTRLRSESGSGAVRMHRQILAVFEPGLVVDHIDGNPLNNQRSNLRVCRQSQNTKNRGINRSYRSSEFKGVTKTKSSVCPWFAKIKADGRSEYIGVFETELAAAVAYDSVARERFGSFAKTNFTRDEESRAIASGLPERDLKKLSELSGLPADDVRRVLSLMGVRK